MEGWYVGIEKKLENAVGRPATGMRKLGNGKPEDFPGDKDLLW